MLLLPSSISMPEGLSLAHYHSQHTIETSQEAIPIRSRSLDSRSYSMDSGIKYKKSQENQMRDHIIQFVVHFRSAPIMFYRPELRRVESLLALRRWVQLTRLCQSIGASPFSSLRDSEVRNLLLDQGICVGVVLQHLSQFFQTDDPLVSSSFPILSKIQLDEVGFHPFDANENVLRTRTNHLRFLQAAYRIASLKSISAFEFAPPAVLKSKGLILGKRCPDYSLGRAGLDIGELLPTLKNIIRQNKAAGYLLGIKSSHTSHAIGLSLRSPYYHFIDPSYGIGIAKSLEQLVLFLVIYLTEKYSSSHSFAIMELFPATVFTKRGSREDSKE